MSVFPHENEEPAGDSDELSKEEKIYEATEDEPVRDDHAFGGSEGTTDGT